MAITIKDEDFKPWRICNSAGDNICTFVSAHSSHLGIIQISVTEQFKITVHTIKEIVQVAIIVCPIYFHLPFISPRKERGEMDQSPNFPKGWVTGSFKISILYN